MRFLFVSAQMPGHLDWGGYLPTAAELAGRGHVVLWASGVAVETPVRAAGVPFHVLSETGWRWPPPPPLLPTPDEDEATTLRRKQIRSIDQWLDEERVAAATDALLRLGETFQPDLIVSEMFIGAAGIAAELLNKPLVVAGWPAPPPADDHKHELVNLARGRLDQLLARYQANGRNWTVGGSACSTLAPASSDLLELRLVRWHRDTTANSSCGRSYAPAAPIRRHR